MTKGGAIALSAAMLWVGAAALGAQPVSPGMSGRIGYDFGWTSTPEWRSLSGFSAGLELPAAWRSIGLRLDYHDVSRGGTDIDRVCGFASCSEGPFGRVYYLKTAGAGLTFDVHRRGRTRISVALNTSIFVQGRELTHRDTGEVSTGDEVWDWGVGPGLDVWLPWGLAGFRPVVSARYARIFQGDCAADASCHHDRNGLSAGLALAWSR